VGLAGLVAAGAALNWPEVDLHQDRRVYAYAAGVLDNAEHSTLVVNHWLTASVFDYLRIVEGRRPYVSSFNIDFYYLALQVRCGTLAGDCARTAWQAWLAEQVGHRPLCFIEPLPEIPDELAWIKQGNCWKLNR
jgi:hypothetical protein